MEARSGSGDGDLAGRADTACGFFGYAVAVAVHSLQGSERAIVRALGLRADAQVCAEAGLLFLCEGFGDPGLAVFVMAAHVFPKIAVDTPDAKQFPSGEGELLDEDAFMRIRRHMGLLQAALELLEFGRVLGREEVTFVRCHWYESFHHHSYHTAEIDSEIGYG